MMRPRTSPFLQIVSLRTYNWVPGIGTIVLIDSDSLKFNGPDSGNNRRFILVTKTLSWKEAKADGRGHGRTFGHIYF